MFLFRRKSSTFPRRLYPSINKVNPKFKDLFDNPFDKKMNYYF